MILVALVVLLVPELLSGPRHTAPRPTSAPGESPMRSYTVQLNDGPTNPLGTQPVPAGQLQPASPVATETPPAPASPSGAGAAQPGAASKPGESIVNPAAAPPPAAVTQSAATPRKTASATHRKAASTETASTKAASTMAASAKAASAGAGWHVQVGSFSTRDHADRLARQLKSKGFGASVSQSVSQGRNWYRVRVGPERDRTAALAMARKLRAAGVTAVVQPP